MDLTFLQHINWWQIVFYAFAAVTFIQLFYYLWFFSRVAFYKIKKKTRSQQHPVSVIVCARDEDENLARHLPGLLVQEYSSTYEIIAVNDNSVDDSKYILQELKKTFKDKLHVVELTQEAKLINGKKYPLSIGIKEADHEGERLGLTPDEVAFYDALEVNDSAVKVLGDDTLREIAKEIADKVRANATIDWSIRESARARMMVIVKRTLTKHGYPPDKQAKAIETVLKQAELMANGLARNHANNYF